MSIGICPERLSRGKKFIFGIKQKFDSPRTFNADSS